MVRGFFADVVQHIGLPELQDRLMGSIEQRLGALPGLEEQETTSDGVATDDALA